MDYLHRSYFDDILTRVKSVILKTGDSPWFEPPLSNKGAPLSAEEVHDNFQILTAGEINLSERVTDIEDYRVEASQNVKGVLAFNGLEEREGYLYGGEPLNILASTDMAADPVNIASPQNAIFYISEGNSLVYIVGSEIDDDNTKWYEVDINFAGTKADLVTYLNERLINNGTPFEFYGVDLTGSFSSRCNWSDTTPSFYISFNDEDARVVDLTANCADANAAAAHLQAQILAKWPEYNGTFTVENSSNHLKLVANSGVAGKRLTRVRIKDEDPLKPLSDAFGIGWVHNGTEAAIFDFSNSMEFYLSGSKMGFRGLGSFSKLVLKDSDTNPLFTTLKLESVVRSSPPYFQGLHTAHPTTSFSTPLNVGGPLYVPSITSEGAITGPITSDTATIGTLNVTTLNASSVNIPDADLNLQDLVADTVTTPQATVTTLEVTTETATTINTTDLTVSDELTAANATIANLNATDASINNLTVTSGTINTNSVTANAVSSNAGNINTLSVNDLIVQKTDRAASRLYSKPAGSAASLDPPTSTNAQAAILSYDGWFRATALYAGSVEVTSARDKKKNIVPAEENALDIINETEIVNFVYKNDETNTKKIGFIADDTHEILATPNHDNMDVGNAIGLLLKAVQELSAENRALRSELSDVKRILNKE